MIKIVPTGLLLMFNFLIWKRLRTALRNRRKLKRSIRHFTLSSSGKGTFGGKEKISTISKLVFVPKIPSIPADNTSITLKPLKR